VAAAFSWLFPGGAAHQGNDDGGDREVHRDQAGGGSPSSTGGGEPAGREAARAEPAGREGAREEPTGEVLGEPRVSRP
jgi:hypothetical protein